MKYRMMALILALSVMSWAQTATQGAPPATQEKTAPADKAKCPCCEKMAAADMKDMKGGCCMHQKGHAKHSGEMASCCGGKDGKSCMKADKDKATATAGCCGKDKMAEGCCGGKDGMSCMKDSKEKAAGGCCGGNGGNQCGKGGCCSSANKSEKPA